MKCIIIDDEKMARDILQQLIAKFPELDLINSFENATEEISFLKSNKIDLIFLDVEMPQMTGIEFITYLAEKLPKVILTTSHKDFAIEAFKYNVSGYLVKPINFENFSLAVKKVLNEIPADSTIKFNDNIVFVKDGKTIVKILLKDIKLIEGIGDYVTLYCNGKKYIVHSTMKEMEKRFKDPDYIRVHRSYIIRFDAIEDIEDDTIAFGEKLVPIGKTYKSEVYKRLNIM